MISLWRLDDRLIHGQVLTVLVPGLSIGAIITVSTMTAGNTFKQDLFRLACPPDLTLYFLDAKATAEQYKQWAEESRHNLFLFDNPQEMLELAKTVGAPPKINLANLSMKPERQMKFDALYLNPTEENALDELARMGSELFYQQVPSAEALPYKAV